MSLEDQARVAEQAERDFIEVVFKALSEGANPDGFSPELKEVLETIVEHGVGLVPPEAGGEAETVEEAPDHDPAGCSFCNADPYAGHPDVSIEERPIDATPEEEPAPFDASFDGIELDEYETKILDTLDRPVADDEAEGEED